MANGDDTTSQDDLGQDYRAVPRAITAPSPAAAAPPMPVAAPGRAPISPPPDLSTTLKAGGRQFPNWTGAAELQAANALRGVPIEQAQQAVQSAIAMQAQRGLARDIQSGMDAAEAMQKWMPTLISAQKTPPTLGQAAEFMRAMTPQPRKIYNTATGLYGLDPGGASVTRLPGQAASVKAPPGLSASMSDTRKALNAYVKQIEQAEASEDVTLKAQLPRLRQRRLDLENVLQAQEIQLGQPQPGQTAPAPVPPRAPTAPPSIVSERVTTRAQFDALAPGATYVGRDGRRYRKPGSTATPAAAAPPSAPAPAAVTPPAAAPQTDTGIPPKLWRRAMSSTGGNASAARRWVRAYYREHPEEESVNPESGM